LSRRKLGYTRLLVKPVKSRWKVKGDRPIMKERTYERYYLYVPSGVDVGDLVGKWLKASRRDGELVFRATE